MEFERAYQEFLSYHCKHSRGERARRLQQGHGHAEREFLKLVWWPSFKSFRGLHPEYEIVDFDGRRRFIDFAYFRAQAPQARLAIEIDGYGPHVTQLDRWQFTNQLRRQNHLILAGWSLLRFSYDEVVDEPWRCQRVLQQFMGRWHGQEFPIDGIAGLSLQERAVIEMALREQAPFSPRQVQHHLGVSRHTAYRILKRLMDQEWLEAAGGTKRIRLYRLHPKRIHG